MTPRVGPSVPRDAGGAEDERRELGEAISALRSLLVSARSALSELEGISSLVANLTFEAPDYRLVGTRALLDRAEELRSDIAAAARRAAFLSHLVDHDAAIIKGDAIDSGSATLVARSLASEERSAMYSLRTRAQHRRVSDALAHVGEIRDMDFRSREVVKFLDGHRMEAITLMRAGQRLSRDEYLSFRNLPSGLGGSVPGGNGEAAD